MENKEDQDSGLHGYCLTVVPLLMKRLDIPAEKNSAEFLKQANCFYEGTEKYGLPMYYEPNEQNCITLVEQQKRLQNECSAQNRRWVKTGPLGMCIDFEAAGSHPLGLIRKRNPHTLIYKFNGMQIDLYRKQEFDQWFETEITDAPQQLRLWKKHFDKWASKKMAKVLQEEDAQVAKDLFDNFMSQLEDESSEAVDYWIGAFENAVDKNQDLILDAIEQELDVNTIFDSFVDNVQEKIEEKEEETVEVNELAEYTTLIATEEELTSMEADESSVFAYGTGIFLGLLAATGIGLYVKKSKTQS